MEERKTQVIQSLLYLKKSNLPTVILAVTGSVAAIKTNQILSLLL